MAIIFEQNNLYNLIQYVDLNSAVNLKTPLNTYYKMHGFNPITQEYEDWHSMNVPLLDPPSGNVLENISIVSTWIDR